MRERRPSVAAHLALRPVRGPHEAVRSQRLERILSWAATVRAALEADPTTDADHLETLLREQAREEYEADAGSPFDLGRYDAIGSIRMNADGLARYWRKRWEREAASLS